MKKIFVLIGLCSFLAKTQVTITYVNPTHCPAGDINFSNSDLTNIENLSNSFRGLQKIQDIHSWGVTYQPGNYWPNGSWGRGYQTGVQVDHNIFLNEITETNGQLGYPGYYQYYLAHHPLMRDVSAFFRGHLYLYESGYDITSNVAVLQDGVDYILSQVFSSGPNLGGIAWWYHREGKYNPNMNLSENKVHVYETAYGLAALGEYILSGLTYRESDVRTAINNCSSFLTGFDYSDPANKADNSNIRALSLWALSISYKVTGNCNTMEEIKTLTTYLINQQSTYQDITGTWQTGGFENDEDCSPMHDTKIFYHFFIIRGLVEAFSTIPDQDADFKLSLVNTIKRAINHIIDFRIDSTNPTDPKLHYWYKNSCGGDLTSLGAISNVEDMECWIDAMAKLRYYAKNSPYFTTQEKENLKRLTNKLAIGLSTNEKWHICAIGSYINYVSAINNNTSVFGWLDADMHYNPDMISGRVVSGDFDNDGRQDDIAAFYDYGNVGGNDKTALHVWKGQNGDHFEGQWSDGWWLSTSYTANNISGRVVSGDFDHDGFKDDIAAFYDYGVVGGNSQTAIHVWISNGSSFTVYQWWLSTSYTAAQITDRVVSGDFDGDNYYDDIAAFYKINNNETRLHVWCSNINSFTVYDGWWTSTNFPADKITGRVVNGNFDNDTKDDDIAAFYDNGNGSTNLHVWTTNGPGSFVKTNVWGATFDASKITKRVIAGNFYGTSKKGEIAAFYGDGTSNTSIKVWTVSGGSVSYFSSGFWNSNSYIANQINGRVVTGNFSGVTDGISDIATFYKYGPDNMRVQVFNGTLSSFTTATSSSWWLYCWAPHFPNKQMSDYSNSSNQFVNLEETPFLVDAPDNSIFTDEIIIYPNPSLGQFYIDKNNSIYSKIQQIKVYDASGKLIYLSDSEFEHFSIAEKGFYHLIIETTNGNIVQKKIVVI